MKFILRIFLLFSFTTAAHAFQVDEESMKKEPIILKYADSLVGSEAIGEKIKKYYGHVKFRQGSMEVSCDKAVQFIDLNKAELIGNVIVTQDTMILKSPRIFYNGNTRIAEALDSLYLIDGKTKLASSRGIYSTSSKIADFLQNVTVEDDSSLIVADRIIYQRKTRVSNAYGNVNVFGKFSNSILTGDTVYNAPSSNYTRATGSPRLFQIDTSSRKDSVVMKMDKKTLLLDSSERISKLTFDTLFVKCDTMELMRSYEESIFKFIGNPEIVRNSTCTKSKYAVFNKRKEYFALSGDPVIWYDSTQLYADSSIIFLHNNRLKAISSIGNAIAVSCNDSANPSRKDQLSGKKIFLFFENDSMRYISSSQEAKSLYFMDDDGEPNGGSKIMADSIFIDFKDNKPFEISWLGGAQGDFYPENVISSSLKTYYLPNFRWSEKKPQKSHLSLRNHK
ncbi:MAG: hypothetical protein NT007_15255 [Candidatus Kapabacteria bacterium]|nr:hypothetical protein [Candidatus Kapabacteria bacterium]